MNAKEEPRLTVKGSISATATTRALVLYWAKGGLGGSRDTFSSSARTKCTAAAKPGLPAGKLMLASTSMLAPSSVVVTLLTGTLADVASWDIRLQGTQCRMRPIRSIMAEASFQYACKLA